MKLRRVKVENIRSFLEPAELSLDGDISILIGPNGGGKTNLLDIVTTSLRRSLLRSWIEVRSPTPELPDRYEFRGNEIFDQAALERHSRGATRPQRIEIELEATRTDLENIQAMKNSASELSETIERRWVGVNMHNAEEWDPSSLVVGQRLTYEIVGNELRQPTEPGASLYHQYLLFYEPYNRLRNELGEVPLSMPILSMPVNRSNVGFQSSLSLANHNDWEYKKTVDAATSRTTGQIMTLAIGRIARRYRILLESDSGTAKREFYDDPQIRSLTSVLNSLGYEWQLECTDPLTNQYNIRLDKQSSSFLVNAASFRRKGTLDLPIRHLRPESSRRTCCY